MGEGYYVYSYNEVCVLVEGGNKGQWMWTATLFCKNLPQTRPHKKKKLYFILLCQGIHFSSGGWCDYIKSNWRLQEPHNKDSTAITLLIAINYAPSLNIIYKNSWPNFTLSQNLFLQLQIFILLHIILLIHIMTSVMYGWPEMYITFYASEITLWSADNSGVINFHLINNQ